VVEVVVGQEYGIDLVQGDFSLCQLGRDTSAGVEEQPEAGDFNKGRRSLPCRIRSGPPGAEKSDAHGGGW
jgi:hypothetical protein